ncbi:hypothetical protein BJ322DRAFT_541029 [Thelephora terrestris]|uniref:Secreted protein n=1 Tax=Thelephora terrestris TaxID=56493 RepID=A0A9P6L9L5_9AGAM|nr:hypothetical protein BJ322DRAFT_541029 [Thelephora terrestris]
MLWGENACMPISWIALTFPLISTRSLCLPTLGKGIIYTPFFSLYQFSPPPFLVSWLHVERRPVALSNKVNNSKPLPKILLFHHHPEPRIANTPDVSCEPSLRIPFLISPCIP